jgi:phage shock protein E
MKRSVALLVLLIPVCLELMSQTTDSVKYKSLKPYDFHPAWLKANKAILIDVREFFEYKKTRIKGAINIPSSGNLDFATDTLQKDKSLFIYCTTGYRSKRVSAKFAEKGFADIYNLEGGIKAWKEDGFPVEKKKLKKIKEK